MREGIIFVLVVLAGLFAFIRAMILHKYRDEINQVPPQLAIPMLIAFKKKHPAAGTVLIVASNLYTFSLGEFTLVV